MVGPVDDALTGNLSDAQNSRILHHSNRLLDDAFAQLSYYVPSSLLSSNYLRRFCHFLMYNTLENSVPLFLLPLAILRLLCIYRVHIQGQCTWM